tara:strand:+ start:744 stop:1220 length:477 start_codon:yes stop_codon:yes gene_type:complete
MHTQVMLRKATLNDANSIALLSEQLGYGYDVQSTKARLQAILNHNEHCVFVATLSDKVVGWVHGFYMLRVESDPFVEIGGLVVDENHRKMGIGIALIEEVKSWSAGKNCQKLRVRCNIIRLESHEFYKQIGFTLNKEQKVFDMPLMPERGQEVQKTRY